MKTKKTSQQLIKQKLQELDSMNKLEAKRLSIPVADMLQEAANLYEWCLKDKEALCGAGLDWKLVEDLEIRAGALRVSEAKWRSENKSFQDCQAEWKTARPAALDLRNELLHHLYYALRDFPGEYSKVQRIGKGSSTADMIQDLIELSELGKKHSKALIAVGVDSGLIDQARSKSFELSRLLAKVNTAKSETIPIFELRNKAYAHLKSALDEIRQVGKYIFWRNEERFKGYTSLYIRKKNQSRRNKAK